MGTDIHAMMESRAAASHPWRWGWYNRGDPEISRCYATFTVLANVRSYSRGNSPISEPRGMPEGATSEFQCWWDWNKGDAHSLSWVTLGELKRHPKDPHSREEIERLIAKMEALKEEGMGDEDVRVCFFFDN